MRVLYCTDTYPPQVNGVSTVTAVSVGGLIRRGWDVGVIAPAYPNGASPPHDPPVPDPLISIPSWSCPGYAEIRLAAPFYRTVVRAVDEFRPDLIHCATEFMIGQMGAFAARRRGIPVVTSYHTDFARYAAVYGVPRLASAVARYLTRFHRRAQRTYTPSDTARSELLQRGVTRVEVWGRGVDVECFQPACRRPGLRRRLGLENAFTFIYVGRVAAEKNVEAVLSAFATTRTLLWPMPVRLIIAGDGPLKAELLGLGAPDVAFLGYCWDRRDLAQLYASADAFVFASTTETLGLVVLEAMASGLPVVVAEAGGVAEHARHGVNGLVHRPGDSATLVSHMEQIARDRALRERLAAGARRTAEALTWEVELDRLDWSYREVCGATSPVSRPAYPVRRRPASISR